MKVVFRLFIDVSPTVLRLLCHSSREKEIILLLDIDRFDKDSLDILLPAFWCFVNMKQLFIKYIFTKGACFSSIRIKSHARYTTSSHR